MRASEFARLTPAQQERVRKNAREYAHRRAVEKRHKNEMQRQRRARYTQLEESNQSLPLKYCPHCGGELTKFIAAGLL